MGHFDIANPMEREARRCRTHAFCARLFAAYPAERSNAGLWEDVACDWDMLALLKERLAEERSLRTKAAAPPAGVPNFPSPLWGPKDGRDNHRG